MGSRCTHTCYTCPTNNYLAVPGVIGEPITIVPTNKTMEVTWSPPAEPNGEVTQYNITWCLIGRVHPDYILDVYEECDDSTSTDTSYTIEGLEGYSQYTVSVAAQTITGMGPFVTSYADTKASGMYQCFVSLN